MIILNNKMLLDLPLDFLDYILTSTSWINNVTLFICKFICHRIKSIVDKIQPKFKIKASDISYVGYLAVLKWAMANGCKWDPWTCSNAAYGGHLAVLKWARANGCNWDSSTCSNAARSGHLAVLQ